MNEPTDVNALSNRITLDERAGWWLIGTVIAKPHLMRLAAGLDADDLSQFDQRTWWRTLQRIHSEGREPNCLVVAEQLAADGTLGDLGGIGEPLRLADLSPYVDHLDEWIPLIQAAAARRRLDSETTRIRQMLADPTVPNAEIAARLVDAGKILEVGRPVQFRTRTSAELDAADLSTEYLVEDVLSRHQSTIIAAAKKSLKTNISIDLTLSLASRCPFLGKFYIANAVRVGNMSGESGDATIQETARRISRSKLWPNLADYKNAVWSFDLPRLGQPQTKRDLTKFIADQALDVLIIDPAYLCLDLGDDAGNLFSVGKKLREMTDIQHESGCTIVIIHHNKKSTGDPFAVPELESIGWSGFQEWARQWLLIGRREKYNPEAAGSHHLWLSAGGSAGHSGLWGLDIEEGSRTDQGGRRWDVTIDGASKVIAENANERESTKEQQARTKAERQLTADAEKLLKEYRKRPQGDTEKYFRERAHLNGARAGAANEKLLTKGRIEPCEVTKNGRAYDGFRLIADSSGLTGTHRDSTGTGPTCPDDEHGAGLTPYRGSPGPAHRDSTESLFETATEDSPGSNTGGRPA